MHAKTLPRRASFQRVGDLYVSDIAHPITVGRRLRLSAKSSHELEEQRLVIEGWVREYRVSSLPLAELHARLARFEHRRVAALSVREAWESFVAASRPSILSKLRSVWKHQLAPLLGECVVVELTPRQMSKWDQKQIENGYAPKTTYDSWTLLVAAVRASLTEGEDFPWRGGRGKYWHPSRRPEVINERPACGTVEEAERLIAAAIEEDRAQRAGKFGFKYSLRLADLANRCAVVLFLGLRNGEGAGLSWEDLVLVAENAIANIQRQAIDQWRTHYPKWTRPLSPTKTKRGKKIAIHPTAFAALLSQRAMLEDRGWYRPNGPVFPGHEGTPFAGQWRNNANVIRPDHMKRLAEMAGLPFPKDWVTHSLKHTFATLESTSGADLRTIQMRTGHATLTALEAYIHARRGRAIAPSSVRELDVDFDPEHDTDPDGTTTLEERASRAKEEP